jgi:diacylglycerol O-acyltransferase
MSLRSRLERSRRRFAPAGWWKYGYPAVGPPLASHRAKRFGRSIFGSSSGWQGREGDYVSLVTHSQACKNPSVPNFDRLTGLDSSFLHLERDAAHMHVAGCMVFEGTAPSYEELAEQIVARLHLVPRYRQRLAFVPLNQGRPVWVDDPHFNVAFHVRHTALPSPGGEEQLKRLAGRVFSQALDRSRPLWELWLVEGLSDDRFALLSKTHHALVDGISGVDIATVLFDSSPDPMPVPGPEHEWIARPLPSRAQLLADALVERATVPAEIARGVRATLRGPRQVAGRIGSAIGGVSAIARAGLQVAPSSPFNVRIGPHRRFTWVRGELGQFKTVKNALGGTVNDVVLASVAGALGRYLRLHGEPTDDLVLKAMVPVSVRADIERGALGNRVAAMWAPLPVGMIDPVQRLLTISREMDGIKDSGQAVGAQVLTELTGFASPTIMAQAARLQARQRLFNLVVTNVPGPQFPLYMLSRQLEAMYPMVPLAENQALGIAIMSYNGQLNFGLNADYDAIGDLEVLADELRASIVELAAAAGQSPGSDPAGRRAVRAVE